MATGIVLTPAPARARSRGYTDGQPAITKIMLTRVDPSGFAQLIRYGDLLPGATWW
jgi:hypothetical protein